MRIEAALRPRHRSSPVETTEPSTSMVSRFSPRRSMAAATSSALSAASPRRCRVRNCASQRPIVRAAGSRCSPVSRATTGSLARYATCRTRRPPTISSVEQHHDHADHTVVGAGHRRAEVATNASRQSSWRKYRRTSSSPANDVSPDRVNRNARSALTRPRSSAFLNRITNGLSLLVRFGGSHLETTTAEGHFLSHPACAARFFVTSRLIKGVRLPAPDGLAQGALEARALVRATSSQPEAGSGTRRAAPRTTMPPPRCSTTRVPMTASMRRALPPPRDTA